MLFQEIIKSLEHHEGWRAYAYQDHKGVWTIGYGFTYFTKEEAEKVYGVGSSIRTVKKHTPIITRAQSDWVLKSKVKQLFDDLEASIPSFTRQPNIVKKVLISMAYNNGVPGLLRFVNMIRALKNSNYGLAAIECIDSKNGRDKLLNKRYINYARMILKGGDK